MNIYRVVGTLKGQIFPSIQWFVSSWKNESDFKDFFEAVAPEYNLEIFYYMREGEILFFETL